MVYSEIEILAWCYAACAWSSFGLFAVSNDVWTVKQGLGRTIHGANTGMIAAFLGFRFLAETPWKLFGLAMSASMGYASKDTILDLVKRAIAK